MKRKTAVVFPLIHELGISGIEQTTAHE